MDLLDFFHSCLISKDYQPFCDVYHVPQTVKHILTECPSLMELRQMFWKKSNGNYRLESILGKGANKENLFRLLEEASFMNI